MLDEKDLSVIQQLLDAQASKILKESAAATKVLLESSINPKLNLLAEGQQALLETLAPKSRVEELEEEVSFLKSIIKLHSEQIAELKKAQ